jgi:hypothetical protein
MIFNKTINIERLTLEIKNSSLSESPYLIISSGSNCDIKFKNSLSPEDEGILIDLVDNHEALPLEEIMPSVSARQIRTAIVLSGLSIATIEAALDGLSEPTRTVAIIAWDHSNLYFRKNPLIVALAPAIGLSEEQLDDLWVLAKTL